MKSKIINLLGIMLIASIALAQTPNSFNYQAVVRDAANELVANRTVSVKISILDEKSFGEVVYEETHSIETNAYGLINIKIGEGESSNQFLDIDWGSYSLYLKVDVDINGGIDYTEVGLSKLSSVPYSIYALDSEYSDSSRVAGESLKSDTAVVAMSLGSDKVHSTNTDTLFVVKDNLGRPVFAVFPDGAKVIVDQTTKGSIGGFAVSGRTAGKASDINFFNVTPDSTRIYINENSGKGSIGGFAVSGRTAGKANKSDYFNISGSSSSLIDVIDPSEARMVWYPKSEAFLVGRVLIEDADSVGTNSFASGFESKAIGNYSQALGFSAIARGNYSTAIGNNSIAGTNENTINAFAFGSKVFALDTNSIAIGYQTVAGAKNSVAIGDSAVANGVNAIALGSAFVDFSYYNGDWWEVLNTSGPIAQGDYSLAIGSGVVASADGSVAIGALDTVSAEFATVFGFRNKATAFGATVGGGETNSAEGYKSVIGGGWNNITTSAVSTIGGGEGNRSSGYNATVAGGSFNNATGSRSVVPGGQGNTASGDYTYASGYYSKAIGVHSTTLGAYWSDAHDYMETVIGSMAIPGSGSQTSWVGSDRLLTIGNGTMSPYVKSNALVLLKNGNLGLGTSSPGTYRLYVDGGNAYFSNDVSAASFTDRTPYPKDLETAYEAVLSMERLPEGEYQEANKDNQLNHSLLHPFVRSSDGEHRDLSATVSAQNEVIKDLIKKIDSQNDVIKDLIKQLEELKKNLE